MKPIYFARFCDRKPEKGSSKLNSLCRYDTSVWQCSEVMPWITQTGAATVQNSVEFPQKIENGPGTGLGCRPGPQLQASERQQINLSLACFSPTFSLPSPLSISKEIKYFKKLKMELS